MKTYRCNVCGKEVQIKNLSDRNDKIPNWRLTAIGHVCEDCYPSYKKIHDKLRDKYNKYLKKKLGEISL